MNAARGIITATNRAMARARAARWMVTATSRVAGNEEEGDDGGDGPWFVCVFLCVWRNHKKSGREQIS
jgi:hypothetical protein